MSYMERIVNTLISPLGWKMPKSKLELERQNESLKMICVNLAWMARRYADGRQTAASSLYNKCATNLISMGVSLQGDRTDNNSVWAKDGGGRAMDHLHDDHINDTPVGRGEVIWPLGTRLCDEITNMLGTDSPSAAALEIKRLKSLDISIPNKNELAIPKKRGRKPKIKE